MSLRNFANMELTNENVLNRTGEVDVRLNLPAGSDSRNSSVDHPAMGVAEMQPIRTSLSGALRRSHQSRNIMHINATSELEMIREENRGSQGRDAHLSLKNDTLNKSNLSNYDESKLPKAFKKMRKRDKPVRSCRICLEDNANDTTD